MSTRPSAVNNDPGYFYDPRKSMVFFALVGAVFMASLVWMILADWDRPWKDDQRAKLLWSSNAAGGQAIGLDEQTAALQRQLAGDGAAAQEALDEKAHELEGLRKRMDQAQGDHYRADKAYKEQRQVTGEAEWHVHESKNDAARSDWTLRYEQALDDEKRLHAVEQEANRRLNALLAEEKEALQAIDAVFERRQKDSGLKRLRLLRDAQRRNASYNPLREVPLIDIMPPTAVEQVVLDSISDNYEFATPKKVDRCATCPFGVFAPASGRRRGRWRRSRFPRATRGRWPPSSAASTCSSSTSSWGSSPSPTSGTRWPTTAAWRAW